MCSCKEIGFAVVIGIVYQCTCTPTHIVTAHLDLYSCNGSLLFAEVVSLRAVDVHVASTRGTVFVRSLGYVPVRITYFAYLDDGFVAAFFRLEVFEDDFVSFEVFGGESSQFMVVERGECTQHFTTVAVVKEEFAFFRQEKAV